MSHKYNKENMLFCFSITEFPADLIVKECLQHNEILFSDKEAEPELYKKKIKLSNCYIVEDSIESKKKRKISKNSNKSKYKETNSTSASKLETA